MPRRVPTGFTMLELSVIIGIGVMMLMVALPSYQMMRNSMSVQNQTYEIVSTLRVAQSRAQTSQDAMNHGVHFTAGTSQYVLFGRDWTSPFKPTTYNLTSGVTIISATRSDIIFGRLKGTTSPAATIVVGFASGMQKTIQIDTTGKIMVL